MERLLDLTQPPDATYINILDQTVTCAHGGPPLESQAAQKVLTQLLQHPDAWGRVDAILEFSQSLYTKFFALQILEGAVKFRWKILPREQCDGIKNYIVNVIVKLSSSEETLSSQKVYIHKLNICLVQILKQEWPHNWSTFVPEIVGSSKLNECLCENNMQILKLLSEDVFDFSAGQLMQSKIKELKESFNKEFSLVYELCEFVLLNSSRESLLVVTLETLLRFLNWIPLGYIFETKMIEMLVNRFFIIPFTRNEALQCLTEIGSLSVASQYDPRFENLYVLFMQQMASMLPPGTDIASAYNSGSERDQHFVQDLALFLSGFFKAHLPLLEKPTLQNALLEGFTYLVEISKVDDVEIFRICLEYYNHLAADLYHTECQFQPAQQLFPRGFTPTASPRRSLYSNVLSRVRLVLIGRMAKPEEVLIVEDEEGNIVKEHLKDSNAIALYKQMRETLIYLTHLDYEDTETLMLDKLNLQLDGQEWSWRNLNTLCWAIGSISGAMTEEEEKRFLVTVIKNLLQLCEMKRGKDHKAVIASNIMYVVGQYPRFLRAHWKFLKTVINKLFEFMHETHPGVQDMAVETFLKIAQKCRRKFVVVQVGESVPFIDELLGTLEEHIRDLERPQIHIFYEAVGHMIHSQPDRAVRDQLLLRLMRLPNDSFQVLVQMANQNVQFIKQPDTTKSIVNILKTNVHVAMSLGHSYMTQLGLIYLNMLNIYKAYSEMISIEVQQRGIHGTKHQDIRSMRSCKKAALELIETFIERSEDAQVVSQNFVPPLLEPVLVDYQRNIPDSRDPEVLSLLASIIERLQGAVMAEVPRIFAAVFECTLEMITKNFEDYPEHRLKFFVLLRAINGHCFPAFFQIPPHHLKLVIDSIVWAFKHTERNIAETGLNILLEFLRNVSASSPEIANSFYQAYFLSLMQDIFVVLTDTMHKPGFKLQATILSTLIHLAESGQVTVLLWDQSKQQYANNSVFLREHIGTLLASAFPNLTHSILNQFVRGLFDLSKDLPSFKAHLRDFLIQLKEFNTDNEDLYDEERQEAANQAKAAEQQRREAIPGMVAPNEKHEDMTDM